MKLLRFYFVLLCAVIGAFFISGATLASSEPDDTYRNGCHRLFTMKEFYTYADRVYKRRTVSHRAQRYVHQRVVCQHSAKKEAWAHRKVKLFKYRRWARLHPWEHRRRFIPYALKVRLANLRGCETRGIEERYGPGADYRYNGHHDGAYQYDGRTWWEAQNWYAARHRTMPSRTTYAYQASPAHQDVVTASFYPSHTGRWACHA